MSWSDNMVRVGTLVLCVHDAVDYFLEVCDSILFVVNVFPCNIFNCSVSFNFHPRFQKFSEYITVHMWQNDFKQFFFVVEGVEDVIGIFSKRSVRYRTSAVVCVRACVYIIHPRTHTHTHTHTHTQLHSFCTRESKHKFEWQLLWLLNAVISRDSTSDNTALDLCFTGC
jgi:hypothetical protein